MHKTTFRHQLLLLVGKLLNYPIHAYNHIRGISNILVVKEDVLGDMITWLPYAQELRRHFTKPKYKIMYMIQKNMLPIVESLGIADQIIINEMYKSPIQWIFLRVKFWLQYDFDLILATTFFPDDMLPVYSHSNSIILYAPQNHGQYDFYKNRVAYQDVRKKYQILLNYAGIQNNVIPLAVEMKFCTLPLVWIVKKYILICPGAGHLHRCWEEKKFSSLIDKLIDTYNLNIMIVGNPKEISKCENIKRHCKYQDRIINLSGKTSLLQLISCVHQAEFVVSTETGTAHVGAVLRKKTFIICGGGDYGHFVPYPNDIEGKYVFSIFREDKSCFPCLWEMPCGNDTKSTCPCLRDISVEQVFQVIIKN